MDSQQHIAEAMMIEAALIEMMWPMIQDVVDQPTRIAMGEMMELAAHHLRASLGQTHIH